MIDRLGVLLREFKERSGKTWKDIAAEADVNINSLKNWSDDSKPTGIRQWKDAVNLAVTLETNIVEASELTRAAGHADIYQLYIEAQLMNDGVDLFAPWLENLQKPAIFHAPPPRGDFMNREDVFDDIVALLQGEEVEHNVLNIAGAPGAGKTAMAIHLAHRIWHYYPDGVVFLRLEQTPPAIVLHRIAHHFQIPLDDSDLTIDTLAETIHKTLDQKQALLIIDDCPSDDLLRYFLPTNGRCQLLITSRYRLMDWQDHITYFLMPPFTSGQGHYYMENKATLHQEADATDRRKMINITKYLGHIPLSLTLVVGQIVTDYVGKIPQFFNVIQHESERLKSLEPEIPPHLRSKRKKIDEEDYTSVLHSIQTTFEIAYRAAQQAGDNVVLAFDCLCLFAAYDVSVDAVAATIGQSKDDTAHYLNALNTIYLIDGYGQPAGRYRIHPILQEHARSKFEQREADEQHAMRERHMAYFVSYANQHRDEPEALAQENNNIRGVLDLAYEQQETQAFLSLLNAIGGYWHTVTNHDMLASYRDKAQALLAQTQASLTDEAQAQCLSLMEAISGQSSQT